eukprot:INCI607.3.p1 GENE.INCI607.3~~INCI607.3.p1  ORF type:complete len:324 (+),score=32.64 INCI607.3:128-1099(+)
MLLLRSSVAAALLAASAAAANAPVCVPTGFSDVCRGSGVRIVVGPYNLTTCNATAWTFRDLWYEGFELLSPTGFTQTVSNVDIAPNTHSTVWPALQPVSPACPVIRQGPNGPPAPGAPAGSGFLGTGHGGEFVFSVTLEVNRSNNGTAGFRSKASAIRKDAATGSEETLAETAARLPTRLHSFQIDAFNILRDGLGGLPPLPVNGSAWPEAVSLAVVKQSQIGPFLATQRVTLFPDRGMQVDANFTLAYANNASAVNWFYSCMTMFALPLTEWVAAFANGTVSEPVKFLADDSFSLQVRSCVCFLLAVRRVSCTCMPGTNDSC